MDSNSFKISLTYDQILEIVRQLPKKDKVKLSTELAKEATDKKLSRLLNAFQSDDISEDEINKEVEKARAELYAKSKKN